MELADRVSSTMETPTEIAGIETQPAVYDDEEDSQARSKVLLSNRRSTISFRDNGRNRRLRGSAPQREEFTFTPSRLDPPVIYESDEETDDTDGPVCRHDGVLYCVWMMMAALIMCALMVRTNVFPVRRSPRQHGGRWADDHRGAHNASSGSPFSNDALWRPTTLPTHAPSSVVPPSNATKTTTTTSPSSRSTGAPTTTPTNATTTNAPTVIPASTPTNATSTPTSSPTNATTVIPAVTSNPTTTTKNTTATGTATPTETPTTAATTISTKATATSAPTATSTSDPTATTRSTPTTTTTTATARASIARRESFPAGTTTTTTTTTRPSKASSLEPDARNETRIATTLVAAFLGT